MGTKLCFVMVFGLTHPAIFAAEPDANAHIVPLFDSSTKLEPATTEDTPQARRRGSRCYSFALRFSWFPACAGMTLVNNQSGLRQHVGECATKGCVPGTLSLWFGADIANNRSEPTRPACAIG